MWRMRQVVCSSQQPREAQMHGALSRRDLEVYGMQPGVHAEERHRRTHAFPSVEQAVHLQAV